MALVIESVVAFDLSVPAQIFGHPDASAYYSFAVCTARPGPVQTSTGFAVAVENGLELLETAQTVVVPGFHPMGSPDPASVRALRAAAERGVRVASVCIGAFALAEAGLLDGRAATTHWQHAERFVTRFPAVRLNPDVLYVDEGDVLTSAGLSAGIDLCLHIVRRDFGQQVAADAARRMVVAGHRTGGQTQYSQRPLPPGGGLETTREWAISEMQRPLTVRHLARHAGMPVRTFARQFLHETGVSPMRWLSAQRVREAQRLLEATDLSVDDVAHYSGFGSAATLRVHLARELGTTPTAYRRRQ